MLGILGLVLGGLLGPIAWWMGSSALKDVDRRPTAYTNRSIIQAGRVCGIISTCILGLAIVAVLSRST